MEARKRFQVSGCAFHIGVMETHPFLGIGKVVKVGTTVFNIFAEPQFTVLREGVGQPEFQFFIGLNTQFSGL